VLLSSVPAKESTVCSSLTTRVFVEANGLWNRSEKRTHGSTASQDRLTRAIGVYQTVAIVTEITPGVTLRVGTSCGPLTTLRRQVRTRRLVWPYSAATLACKPGESNYQRLWKSVTQAVAPAWSCSVRRSTW
jgi:hypothetical protein